STRVDHAGNVQRRFAFTALKRLLMQACLDEPVVGTGEYITTNLEVDEETQVNPFPGERVIDPAGPVCDTVTNGNIVRASHWPTVLVIDKVAIGVALLHPACDHTIRITDNVFNENVSGTRLFTNHFFQI